MYFVICYILIFQFTYNNIFSLFINKNAVSD